MTEYFATLATLVITCLLIVVLKPLAHKVSLIAIPGGHKAHDGDIPLVGGIAMFCGFTFALIILQQPLGQYYPLLAALGLLMVVGILDDLHEIRPRPRLAVQVAAALIMVLWGDKVIVDIGVVCCRGPLTLGVFSIPFTVFAVVGAINAMNMTDGIDGLTGMLALITSIVLCVVAFGAGQMANGWVLLILVSAILGFLSFNFPFPVSKRARVFMGDAGSTFLGCLLAWFLIDLSQGQHGVLPPSIALWLFAIPLLDTLCLIYRRTAQRRSPFCADRNHLHHILMAIGYSSRATLLIIVTAAVCCAAIGLIGYYDLGIPEQWMLWLFFILLYIYYRVVRYLARRACMQAEGVQPRVSKSSSHGP